MKATDFLVRTAKGEEEIRERKHKLSSRLRMLLLLVDGRHTAGELADHTTKIGLPRAAIADLLTQGFVSTGTTSPTTPAAGLDETAQNVERYRAARQFMTTTIVDALGIRSFFFTLKIERCSTLTDLRDLLDDYNAAMTKALGNESAAIFVARMKEMLK